MTFRDTQVSFYKSGEWKRLREAVMVERGRLCEDCLERGIITPAEEVHHLQKLDAATINDPSIALNPDNLRCLCRACHEKRHSSRNHTFDEDGNIVYL